MASRDVTIKHVADAAGVARSSVSRAFTRPDMLKPETVERVLQIAKELGYVPNHTARALSTGRTGNIALVVPDVANPFFPPLIRAAQMQADLSDFCVFLGHTEEDAKTEDKLLSRFAGQVEGVVLASSRMTRDRIRAHAEVRPLVLINRDVPGIPRVLIDSRNGVKQAIEHLIALGHVHIAYVSGPASSWSNKQMLATVKAEARKAKIKINIIETPAPRYDAGVDAAREVLKTRATGVIGFDDLIAQGVMAGLASANVNVPHDISVIGCDDVLGAATYPALTTVSTRSDEAGRVGVSLLVDVLTTKSISDVRYLLDTHLVVRKSTGPKKDRS